MSPPLLRLTSVSPCDGLLRFLPRLPHRQPTLLAEILSAAALPGSVDLLSCLLETLSRVVHTHSGIADKSYLEQVLMTAIGNVVMRLQVCFSALNCLSDRSYA